MEIDTSPQFSGENFQFRRYEKMVVEITHILDLPRDIILKEIIIYCVEMRPILATVCKYLRILMSDQYFSSICPLERWKFEWYKYRAILIENMLIRRQIYIEKIDMLLNKISEVNIKIKNNSGNENTDIYYVPNESFMAYQSLCNELNPLYKNLNKFMQILQCFINIKSIPAAWDKICSVSSKKISNVYNNNKRELNVDIYNYYLYIGFKYVLPNILSFAVLSNNFRRCIFNFNLPEIINDIVFADDHSRSFAVLKIIKNDFINTIAGKNFKDSICHGEFVISEDSLMFLIESGRNDILEYLLSDSLIDEVKRNIIDFKLSFIEIAEICEISNNFDAFIMLVIGRKFHNCVNKNIGRISNITRDLKSSYTIGRFPIEDIEIYVEKYEKNKSEIGRWILRVVKYRLEKCDKKFLNRNAISEEGIRELIVKIKNVLKSTNN